MDINAAFPSTYLKASDLQGRDVVVNISHITMEDVGDDHKPVIYFVGKDKGVVLNKTNASTIAGMYTGDTDNWVNKAITLFPTQTDFGGKQVACIRIRITAPVTTEVGGGAPPTALQTQDLDNQDLDDTIPF